MNQAHVTDIKSAIVAHRAALQDAKQARDAGAIARESAAITALSDYLTDFEKEHSA